MIRLHTSEKNIPSNPGKRLRGVLAAVLALTLSGTLSLLTACGGGSSTAASSSSSAPAISSFTASQSSIASGTLVTLNWTVSNAATVTINGTAVSGSSMSVSPTTTTTYTLAAVNSSGQSTTATVTVTVLTSASIGSFTVSYNGTPSTSATAITSGVNGENAILSWSVSNATSVTLNGVDVTNKTSYTVAPTASTVYVLQATNSAGVSVSMSLTVAVEAAPSISSFTTSATAPLNYGDSFTFKATYSCNKATSLSPTPATAIDYLTEMLAGRLSTSATATTTYTLTCTNNAGDSTSSQTTVQVLPAAALTSTPSTINAGDSATLNWTSYNATGLKLYSYAATGSSSSAVQLADVTGQSSYSVTPSQSTVYYLTASNDAGNANSATTTVSIATALQDIASFMAYQSSALAAAAASTPTTPAVASTYSGGSVYLVPSFANHNSSNSSATDTAVITDASGNAIKDCSGNTISAVTSGSAYCVAPTQTTTYTLKVTNATYSPIKTQSQTLRVVVGNVSIFQGEGLLYKAYGDPYPFVEGAATSTTLSTPSTIAAVPDGSAFYVPDQCSVIGLTPSGTVSIFAGQPYSLALAAGTSASCNPLAPYYSAVTASSLQLGGYLNGLVADTSGNVYVADSFLGIINKISNGKAVTLAGYAGNTTSTVDIDGVGSLAGFPGVALNSTGMIYALLLDSQGEVVVVETHSVRVLDSSNKVTTIAGASTASVITDGSGLKAGPAPRANFQFARSAAIDPTTDTIYIVDKNTIRKMVPDKSTDTSSCHAACWIWTVSTIYNASNTAGHVDGPASVAKFAGPVNIARTADGTLFVTDGYYIRRIATNGQVDTIAGQGDFAGSDGSYCSSGGYNHAFGTLYTLPNANNLNPVTLPGSICASYNITVDPSSSQTRLFFITHDNASIYQMPY